MNFNEDSGKLILRLVLGILVLFHGVHKLMNGISFISDMVGPLAYLVYLGEVVGPVLLIIGAFTRVGALLVAVNMIVALLLVHTGQLLTLTQSGGYALELQAMYLFTAIAVLFLGGGKYGVKGGQTAWN